jgi:hypothetical protein
LVAVVDKTAQLVALVVVHLLLELKELLVKVMLVVFLVQQQPTTQAAAAVALVNKVEMVKQLFQVKVEMA